MCFQNSLWVHTVHPFPGWKVIKKGADFLNDNYKGEEREKGRNEQDSPWICTSHTILGVQNILRDKLQEEEKGIPTQPLPQAEDAP